MYQKGGAVVKALSYYLQRGLSSNSNFAIFLKTVR